MNKKNRSVRTVIKKVVGTGKLQYVVTEINSEVKNVIGEGERAITFSIFVWKKQWGFPWPGRPVRLFKLQRKEKGWRALRVSPMSVRSKKKQQRQSKGSFTLHSL